MPGIIDNLLFRSSTSKNETNLFFQLHHNEGIKLAQKKFEDICKGLPHYDLPIDTDKNSLTIVEEAKKEWNKFNNILNYPEEINKIQQEVANFKGKLSEAIVARKTLTKFLSEQSIQTPSTKWIHERKMEFIQRWSFVLGDQANTFITNNSKKTPNTNTDQETAEKNLIDQCNKTMTRSAELLEYINNSKGFDNSLRENQFFDSIHKVESVIQEATTPINALKNISSFTSQIPNSFRNVAAIEEYDRQWTILRSLTLENPNNDPQKKLDYLSEEMQNILSTPPQNLIINALNDTNERIRRLKNKIKKDHEESYEKARSLILEGCQQHLKSVERFLNDYKPLISLDTINIYDKEIDSLEGYFNKMKPSLVSSFDRCFTEKADGISDLFKKKREARSKEKLSLMNSSYMDILNNLKKRVNAKKNQLQVIEFSSIHKDSFKNLKEELANYAKELYECDQEVSQNITDLEQRIGSLLSKKQVIGQTLTNFSGEILQEKIDYIEKKKQELEETKKSNKLLCPVHKDLIRKLANQLDDSLQDCKDKKKTEFFDFFNSNNALPDLEKKQSNIDKTLTELDKKLKAFSRQHIANRIIQYIIQHIKDLFIKIPAYFAKIFGSSPKEQQQQRSNSAAKQRLGQFASSPATSRYPAAAEQETSATDSVTPEAPPNSWSTNIYEQ